MEGELDSFDLTLARAIDLWRGKADAVMLAATRAGGPRPMTALSVLVLVWLVLRKKPREARLLAVGAGGCAGLNELLKLAFQRARPNADLLYLIAPPESLSFPSGHTMGTTGVIGCLVLLSYALRAPRAIRWLATVLGFAVIALVGISRVYLGAHYPSDVLGGFLAAAAWLSAVAGFTYPRLLPGEHDATVGK